MRSRPLSENPPTLINGSVRRAIHVIENNSAMRISIAAISPTWRAFFCSPFLSLADRMEMKMTLSTPRTISRTVSVANATNSSVMWLVSQNSQHMKIEGHEEFPWDSSSLHSSCGRQDRSSDAVHFRLPFEAQLARRGHVAGQCGCRH